MKKYLLVSLVCLLTLTASFIIGIDLIFNINTQKLKTTDVKKESKKKNMPAKTVELKLLPIQDSKTQMFGYQTPQGEQVINAKFVDARPFSEGLAAVYNGARWGYINTKGEYVIAPKFGGYSLAEEIVVNPFVNGTAAVFMGVGNANGISDEFIGKYALIDKAGTIIKQFDTLYPTWYGAEGGNVGEYHAKSAGQWYIVNSQGNILKKGF